MSGNTRILSLLCAFSVAAHLLAPLPTLLALPGDWTPLLVAGALLGLPAVPLAAWLLVLGLDELLRKSVSHADAAPLLRLGLGAACAIIAPALVARSGPLPAAWVVNLALSICVA